MPCAPTWAPEHLLRELEPMQDLLWLAILGGLFLATLAYVRLCEEA
jgi:hypothetical protein